MTVRGWRLALLLTIPILLGGLAGYAWMFHQEQQAPEPSPSEARPARARELEPSPATRRPARTTSDAGTPARLARMTSDAGTSARLARSRPRVVRALPSPTPRSQKLHRLGEKLGAPGHRIENPCVSRSEELCTRTALQSFFESLDGLTEGTATSPVVISAFGNSLIAGDRIVDILREDLGTAFGNGGRGVLLVDRLAPYGPRSRTGYARGGWKPRTLGELHQAELPFGITGIYHQATSTKSRSRFSLDGEPRGTVWWLDAPRAGHLSLRVDGKEVARTEPTGSGEARGTSFDIPEGARTLELVSGRGAVVQGVVLQRQRPGIVLDTLGVPSADANLFLRGDESIFRAQLAERSPRLMVFILGGNEAKRLEWGRSELHEVEQGLRDFLARTRAAAPESACLVVGPIDAVRGGKGARRLQQRPYLDEVIALERKVALAGGCAFFDSFTAMGGSGSLARFVEAGLVHSDLVHPRGQGLDLIGQLITDALLRAWVEDQHPQQAALAPATVEEVVQ